MSANFAELMKNVKSSLSDLERTRWAEDPSLPGQLGKALVRIDDLTAENVDYRGKMMKQKGEIEDLKTQLETSKKNEDEHRHTISHLQITCDLWKMKYTNNLETMTVAHNSTMILEKKCAGLEEIIKQLRAKETMTVEHYKTILGYKEMEVDELTTQLKDAEEKVASLSEDYTNLESNSDEWATFLSKKVELLEEKMKTAEEELKDKTTDLADARTELGLQNNQLHDQTDEIYQQKAEIKKMKEEMEEDKETIQKLREENASLQASESKSRLRDMENHMEYLERIRQTLQTELEEKNKILAVAKKELDVWQEQDTYQAEHELKDMEIEELREQLDASKQSEYGLRGRLKAAESKIEIDRQLIVELQEQMKVLVGLGPKPQGLNLTVLNLDELEKQFTEAVDEDVKRINAEFVEESNEKITSAIASTMGPEEPKVCGASEEPCTSENWWHKDYVTDSSDNWEDCSSESHEDEEEGDESDAWSREANP